MKKFIISALLIAGTLSAFAQKITTAKVPYTVKNSFEIAHPNVTGHWEKEDGNYEISFMESGKQMSCVVDKQGTILESETAIAVAELPQAIKDYVKINYKKAKIKEASTIINTNGVVMYEAFVGTKDLLFDKGGKFIKAIRMETND
jgi:biopolymer transport protein ExbD